MKNLKCCSKCGKNAFELARQGRYLKRTSGPADEFEGRCYPDCNSTEKEVTEALKKTLEENFNK